MQKPERLSFREFVKFYAVEIPTALAGVAIMVAIGWAAGSIAKENVVHASVGPRPTVELMKGFSCRIYGGHTDCVGELESSVNRWLQEQQPWARVMDRKMLINEGRLYVFIFYEVPEWRVKEQPKNEKLPAERVP